MTGTELAQLADRYLAGDLEFFAFLDAIPELPANALTNNLYDLVEHMPVLHASDGTLTKRGAAYLAEIQHVVEQLRLHDEELT